MTNFVGNYKSFVVVTDFSKNDGIIKNDVEITKLTNQINSTAASIGVLGGNQVPMESYAVIDYKTNELNFFAEFSTSNLSKREQFIFNSFSFITDVFKCDYKIEIVPQSQLKMRLLTIFKEDHNFILYPKFLLR